MLLGLQERIKRKVDARERIISFIPEYAAYLAIDLAKEKVAKYLMKE